MSVVVGGFVCYSNNLKTFKNIPKIVTELDIYHNNISTIEGFTNIKQLFHSHNPIHNIFKLFNDIDTIREPETKNGKPIVILDFLNYFLSEIDKPMVSSVDGYDCI